MEKKVQSDLVRELRAIQNWSQEVLAEKAGISLRTVQRIENDGVASFQSLVSIAKALGVPRQDLESAENDNQVLSPVVSRSGIFRYRRMLVPALAMLLVAVLAFITSYYVVSSLESPAGPVMGARTDLISREPVEEPGRFQPVRIPDDEAPAGMRVVETPFGDRLVPIKEPE